MRLWYSVNHCSSALILTDLSIISMSNGIFPEKAMAPHSSTLAWKIPWMEEPGRLQTMGSLRVGHDWATDLIWSLEKWKPSDGDSPVSSLSPFQVLGVVTLIHTYALFVFFLLSLFHETVNSEGSCWLFTGVDTQHRAQSLSSRKETLEYLLHE